MIRRRTALIGLAALATPARAATPLTIALSSNTLAYGGLRIAEQAGLFQHHGLEPRIIVMDSGSAAIAALVAGSAQVASSGPGEVLAARVRGREIVIVANVYRGLSGSVVLAKKTADALNLPQPPPVAARLRALDGLVVAAPSATSAYLHPVKSAAEAAGARVKFTYMAQPAMVAALQAGAVQGIVAGAPFSLTAVSNGSGVLWISGPGNDLPPEHRPASSACLQVTPDYARANRPVLQALRNVFAEMKTLIETRPAEAKAFLAKAYPQLDLAGIESAFAESAANWSQPEMTADDLRQEIRIQAATGSLPGVDKIDPAAMLQDPR